MALSVRGHAAPPLRHAVQALAVTLALLPVRFLAGCHHVAPREPEPALASFDAEIFPAVARWADSMNRPGPVVFDPRPFDKWVERYSALAQLPKSSVEAMRSRREAVLAQLRFPSRIEKDLESRCVSTLFPAASAAESRRLRSGCPADHFTYVQVAVPSHGPGRPLIGGEPRVGYPDSAYVSVSAEHVGPGGWSVDAYDLVLGRSSTGWKVARIAIATIME